MWNALQDKSPLHWDLLWGNLFTLGWWLMVLTSLCPLQLFARGNLTRASSSHLLPGLISSFFCGC